MVERIRNLERLKFTLSPASINSYYRCPRKFNYRYFRGLKTPFVFKPALAIGLVTHNTIAEVFRIRRDGRSEGAIEDLVWPRLQTARYPDDAVRKDHFPIIVSHAEQAIRAIPSDATVLEVEHDYEFSYSDGYLADEITVKCRVDLVIEHGDGLVDHIDFKTGGQGGDLIQNFLSRVTVKNNLKEVPSEKLRTVNVMTRDGLYEVVPSDRSVHAATWETVKGAIRNLAEDDEWRARPDPPVCRWCEFNLHCDQADLGSDDQSGWDRD